MLNEITIYTDGSCLGNPGPGGWAAIILVGSRRFELSGGEDTTDNNRMEMIALIESLKLLQSTYKINVYSDSGFIVDVFNNKSLNKWKRNGWKSANNKKVAYKDLWKHLEKLARRHYIKFHHIKAHTGNKYNEKCDDLARYEAEKRSQKIKIRGK